MQHRWHVLANPPSSSERPVASPSSGKVRPGNPTLQRWVLLRNPEALLPSFPRCIPTSTSLKNGWTRAWPCCTRIPSLLKNSAGTLVCAIPLHFPRGNFFSSATSLVSAVPVVLLLLFLPLPLLKQQIWGTALQLNRSWAHLRPVLGNRSQNLVPVNYFYALEIPEYRRTFTLAQLPVLSAVVREKLTYSRPSMSVFLPIEYSKKKPRGTCLIILSAL